MKVLFSEPERSPSWLWELAVEGEVPGVRGPRGSLTSRGLRLCSPEQQPGVLRGTFQRTAPLASPGSRGDRLSCSVLFRRKDTRSHPFQSREPHGFYLLIAQNVRTVLFHIKPVFIPVWLSPGLPGRSPARGAQLKDEPCKRPGSPAAVPTAPASFLFAPALKNKDTHASAALHCQKV